VKGSEFAEKIGPLAKTGPFRVEIQPDDDGDWQLVETYADVAAAWDASQRALHKHSGRARILNARGGVIFAGGSFGVPIKRMPAALLGLARLAARQRRERDET
jgi:hypothetical protein